MRGATKIGPGLQLLLMVMGTAWGILPGQAMAGASQPATQPVPSRSIETPEQPADRQARIAVLIEQLGAATAADRQSASRELLAIGLPARAALEKAATDKNQERAHRAMDILKDLNTISGTVTDEAGKPIYDAVVILANSQVLTAQTIASQRSTVRGPLESPGLASTDRQGRFRFDSLLPGTTDMIVCMDGLRARRVPAVAIGTTGLEIRLGLPSRYSISGCVLDDQGRPVPETEVVLVEREYGIPRPPSLTTVRTDASGRFHFPQVFDPLTAQDFRARMLLIRKDGYAFWMENLDCTGGQTNVTARLSRPTRLTGVVTDGQGKPLAGASVWLLGFNLGPVASSFVWHLRQLESLAPRAVTDKDGAFAIEAVPPGGVAQILATCPNYGIGFVDGIDASTDAKKLPPIFQYMVKHPAGQRLTLELPPAIEVVNSRIEQYAVQHRDRLPGVDEKGRFDGQLFNDQLTMHTDYEGRVYRGKGKIGDYPAGPHLYRMPSNPHVPAASGPDRVKGGPGPSPNDGTSGWWFDTKAKVFGPNHVRSAAADPPAARSAPASSSSPSNKATQSAPSPPSTGSGQAATGAGSGPSTRRG